MFHDIAGEWLGFKTLVVEHIHLEENKCAMTVENPQQLRSIAIETNVLNTQKIGSHFFWRYQGNLFGNGRGLGTAFSERRRNWLGNG